MKNVFGGLSRLGFKSADQGREKFQGASLDFVWFDEEPPEDVYRECQMRVLDKKGDIFGTMTPLKGQTWVYDEIYLNKGQSPEVWYEQMEWADNPYLDEKEVEMLSNSLSDDVKDSRRYGRFKTYNGLVYPEFDVNVHVIEPFSVPEEWQADISIDPGLNNPLSCHFTRWTATERFTWWQSISKREKRWIITSENQRAGGENRLEEGRERTTACAYRQRGKPKNAGVVEKRDGAFCGKRNRGEPKGQQGFVFGHCKNKEYAGRKTA